MVKRLSKRMRVIRNSLGSLKKCDVFHAISLLKKLSCVNFSESIDVSVQLGINSRKSEQNVRGNVFLPHGIGRDFHIIVFTQGMNVKLAKDAGADLVGLDELVDYFVNSKKNRFDVVVATPDVMHIVGKLGSILGPRGLMPNPKCGTVSDNIADIIKKIKMGQIRYRNDKYGIVHTSIGRVSFGPEQLKENLEYFIVDLKKNKPYQSKGIYIKKIMLSTTMGGSILIDQNSIL